MVLCASARVGLGIFLYHTIMRLDIKQNKAMGLALLGIALYLFAAFLVTRTARELIPQHFLYAIAFCILALAALIRRAFLSNRVTCLIGKLSFSIYPHAFRYHNSGKAASALAHDRREPFEFGCAFALVLVVSLGLSALTYLAVEHLESGWASGLLTNWNEDKLQ